MAVCYKKLWKLLIDKDMTAVKLGRDENVNTEVLAKICKTLDCKIEDIMEMVPDEEEK